MTNRIETAFAHKAKIAYLTAGDGGIENSLRYFMALIDGGANILEIGLAFSDPIADGGVIQKAMSRVIDAQITHAEVFSLIKQIRQLSDVAIIVFTYYNQIQANLENFMAQLSALGVDGILVVDLPYEESQELFYIASSYGIAVIMVASTSTPLERISQLTSHGSGFLYYACQQGTTGMRNCLPKNLQQQIMQVKQHSSLPVAVGFGVANNGMVRELLSVADGCVIGSYFVQAVEDNMPIDNFKKLVKDMYANDNG